ERALSVVSRIDMAEPRAHDGREDEGVLRALGLTMLGRRVERQLHRTRGAQGGVFERANVRAQVVWRVQVRRAEPIHVSQRHDAAPGRLRLDRMSTRLNSNHVKISYA